MNDNHVTTDAGVGLLVFLDVLNDDVAMTSIHSHLNTLIERIRNTLRLVVDGSARNEPVVPDRDIVVLQKLQVTGAGDEHQVLPTPRLVEDFFGRR
ncbi:hypothetical protein D3C86_1551880 [compost metagenome]